MISLIAAVAENGVIGSKNSLPWYIPEDLKHFKELSTGKTVLMGRNTYDSVIARLGKPLPNRKNVVVSRNTGFKPAEGVEVYSSIDEALDGLKNAPEIIVMGGAQIYAQTIDKADKLFITEVHKSVDGDVKFPEINKNTWKEISREDHEGYSFVEYSIAQSRHLS